MLRRLTTSPATNPTIHHVGFFYFTSMIEVKTQSRYGLVSTHMIYEKHEAIPQGKFCFDWQVMTNAMRGDYVRDFHGRQVPVLFRKTLRRATGQDVMLVFPGQAWLASKHGHRAFIWSLSPRTGMKLNLKHKLFAQMLARGANEITAYQAVWTSTPKKAIPYKLIGLYCNEKFIMLFLETTGIMSTLKKALEERNINANTVAEKLADLLDDTEVHVSLRKMAFEKVIEILEEKDKAPLASEIQQKHQLKPGEIAAEMRITMGAKDQNTSQALPGGNDITDLGSVEV